MRTRQLVLSLLKTPTRCSSLDALAIPASPARQKSIHPRHTHSPSTPQGASRLCLQRIVARIEMHCRPCRCGRLCWQLGVRIGRMAPRQRGDTIAHCGQHLNGFQRGPRVPTIPNRSKQESLARCKGIHYTFSMIESFVYKGLEKLFARGVDDA